MAPMSVEGLVVKAVIDTGAEVTVISTSLFESGYCQLALAESDRDTTAFITKYGLYEYAKMNFGLCNDPSTFQRCVELILRGLQWKTPHLH